MIINFDINFCKYKGTAMCYRCNKMCPTLKSYLYNRITKPINNILSMIKYDFHECTDKESICPCRAYDKYCTECKTCDKSK